MKRILSLLCLMLMLSVVAFAKGNEMPQYDITGAGSGNEGMLLVKVFVYSKKVTDQDLKRAAVHGVVFEDVREIIVVLNNQRWHQQSLKQAIPNFVMDSLLCRVNVKIMLVL